LCALPPDFRGDYADEILSFHRARMGDAARSTWQTLRMWSHGVWDVLLHGCAERATRMRRNVVRACRSLLGRTPQDMNRHDPGSGGPIRALRSAIGIDSIAFRRLAKSPRFTFVAALTLGLGIGANTALFSIVYSVLLSPLPYADSERLVFALETRNEGSSTTSVSLGNFETWRESSASLGAMAAARYRAYNVTGGDRPYRVNGLEASAGTLSLLGVRPLYGREFLAEDERPGADPVCMVSHAFWIERLGANPDLGALGLRLNGRSHAVVGVMPAGFELPGFGASPILTPLPLDPSHPGYWSNHNSTVLGRLASGVALSQADEELSLIAARLENTHAEWNDGIGARLVPARERLVRNVRRTLWILFGTVGFVLLIACVNVASLMLARAAAVEREMAVRVALGASRLRIVRLVLSEALLLSAGGALLGLAIGYGGVEALRRWGPSGLPRLAEVSVSVPVLWFTMACALGTGLLFGLVPALRASRVDIQATLNKSSRTPGLGGQHRLQRTFVMVEVAIAVVLLNCSGLLLRTFTNLLHVDAGFDPKGRVAMHVDLSGSRYTDHEQVVGFLDRLHEELNAIPGVQASGSSVGLPLQWLMWRQYLTVEGRPAATLPEVPVVDLSVSTPDYVPTLGIRLIRGRPLAESDDAESPYVALVNEAFIRRNLPGEEAIGRRFRLAPPDDLLAPGQRPSDFPWYSIVGVVGDVQRWELGSEATPEVYVPVRQHPGVREFFVVVHSAVPGVSVSDAMRQAVWSLDPDQPVAWVQPMESMFSSAVSQPRLNAALVAAFGATALILAVIGVYGLMANMVKARTNEIGVRLALGARPDQILRRVAGQGLLAAAIGIAFGVAASAVVTRLMGSMLFGVTPLDPATFSFAVISVLVAAAVAASVPSRQAAKLDPIAALASE